MRGGGVECKANILLNLIVLGHFACGISIGGLIMFKQGGIGAFVRHNVFQELGMMKIRSLV